MAGVYLAEWLNSILANNWKSFATQNYFDSHGLFLSVLWSGPLLVVAIVVLVSLSLSLSPRNAASLTSELHHDPALFVGKHPFLTMLLDCEMEEC